MRANRFLGLQGTEMWTSTIQLNFDKRKGKNTRKAPSYKIITG
jgi:hypothetical protein